MTHCGQEAHCVIAQFHGGDDGPVPKFMSVGLTMTWTEIQGQSNSIEALNSSILDRFSAPLPAATVSALVLRLCVWLPLHKMSLEEIKRQASNGYFPKDRKARHALELDLTRKIHHLK